MMNKQTVTQLIKAELTAPNFTITQQYLAIHQVLYDECNPIISRITAPDAEGVTCAYLPVQDEQFYLVFYLNSDSICGLGTEPWHRVSLRATSETLSGPDMATLTTVTPTEQWSRGDARPIGKGHYSFSALRFLPNPEPDTFEHKLDQLLDLLEKDRKGIQRLVEQTACGIDVAMDMHNGSGMLGGIVLTTESIQRIAALGLNIEFDLYAVGKSFLE